MDVLDIPKYIKEQRNGTDVLTVEAEAMGVLSSDETTRWHLHGRAVFSERNFGDVIVVEITDEEGERMREQLFGNGGSDNDEGGGEEGDEGGAKEYETSIALQQKVDRLMEELKQMKEENDSLNERSDFIEECLMEMSLLIYA